MTLSPPITYNFINLSSSSHHLLLLTSYVLLIHKNKKLAWQSQKKMVLIKLS